MQYKLDDTRQIYASYSRRIQRPTAQDLNPYRIYQDPYSYRQGDPRLKPQTTDLFEVGYQLRKGYNYYQGTLYYREARDGVTDVIRDIGDGVLLTSKANLAKSRSGGLELVANARLTPKISYTISGNAFWNEIGATDLGFPDKRSAWTCGPSSSASPTTSAEPAPDPRRRREPAFDFQTNPGGVGPM